MFAGLWGYLIAGLIALGGVGAALFGARKAGADAEKAKTATATAAAAQTRAATQDEVARTAPATRREALKQWSRK